MPGSIEKKLVLHKLYTPDEYLVHNILHNYYESQINWVKGYIFENIVICYKIWLFYRLYLSWNIVNLCEIKIIYLPSIHCFHFLVHGKVFIIIFNEN